MVRELAYFQCARDIAVIIAAILPSFIIAISDVYNASFIKNVALCTTLKESLMIK